MQNVSHSEISYPPTPYDEHDAIQQGTKLRLDGDNNLWQIGWHAAMVTEQFGSSFFQIYAAQIKKPRATLTRIRWVASRYTPEQVNRFPGLPFTFFEIVTPLMDVDPETALDFLEKAFDTPDITCEQFAMLVNPTDVDAIPPPFRSEGTFGAFPIGDDLIIGVRVSGAVTEWQHKVKESPLYGQLARLAISHIAI